MLGECSRFWREQKIVCSSQVPVGPSCLRPEFVAEGYRSDLDLWDGKGAPPEEPDGTEGLEELRYSNFLNNDIAATKTRKEMKHPTIADWCELKEDS